MLWSGVGLGIILGGCDEAEHVRFRNGEIAITGEVWKPEASGSYPAVAFIGGASAGDDLRALAKLLAEQGIVSLLYDQRGAADSSGGWTEAELQTLAGEALAGIAYLQQRPDIQKNNTGLAGFGQGGGIALLAASSSTDIAFVITIARPAVAPRESVDYDLLTVLQSLRTPVLMLFGGRDDSVAVEKRMTSIATAMREAGKKYFAFRILPNADRDLYTKPYHDSPLPLLQNLPLSRRFEPEALEAMAYWIKVVSPLYRTQAE